MSLRFDGNSSAVDCYVANAINIGGFFQGIWVNPIRLHLASSVQQVPGTEPIIGLDRNQWWLQNTAASPE